MAPKGKHPVNALSAAMVRKVQKHGRYADGSGLYLVVDQHGKRWLLRTVIKGRRRDIGLGSARLVSLADAREAATECRKTARAGGDPLADRRRARRHVKTFKEAAKAVHEERANHWRNPKHRAQWLSTLETYAFPSIGDLPVDKIETPDVRAALSPIWLTKPETARRVKQRIGAVLDWAKGEGLRDGENPVASVAQSLGKQQGAGERHHAALPFAQMPEFIQDLQGAGAGSLTKLALEFLILTATRTTEVRLATWGEVDIESALWTVPAERMKANKAHEVPLPDRAVEILREARPLASESEYLFPSNDLKKPLSNMAMLALVKRMGFAITVHGFRSAFRDWAAETTNFPRSVCEMALAHTIQSKAEAAYRRGNLLERRRELMAAWASYMAGTKGEVVPLRAGGGNA